MSSDNLNPGASSFTPGGGSAAMPPPTGRASAKQDSFRVYEEMMDTIEAEFEVTDVDDLSAGMNETLFLEKGGGAVHVDSSLPPHLAHQAAEFWFPECRDCTCCNGFKHACTCSGRVCKCSSQSSSSPVLVVGSSLRPTPSGPGRGHGARGGSSSGRGSSGRGGRGNILCKFLQSPQGCRFGDQCRFAHE